MSDVFKALAYPVRREILVALKAKALSAGELADIVEISKPTLSGHLNILKEANLVFEERAGNRRLYRINLSVVEEAFSSMLSLLRIGEPSSSVRLSNHSKAETK